MSPSDSGSDTIEMDTLDEIAVTPAPHVRQTPYIHDSHVEDDDSGDEDEDDGERALLTPGDRPRGRERIPSREHDTGVWVQVKRIVIEVSVFEDIFYAIIYIFTLTDSTHSPFDYYWTLVYRRTSKQRFSAFVSFEAYMPQYLLRLPLELESNGSSKRTHYDYSRRSQPQGQPGDESVGSSGYCC